jgi:hypothetical protein
MPMLEDKLGRDKNLTVAPVLSTILGRILECLRVCMYTVCTESWNMWFARMHFFDDASRRVRIDEGAVLFLPGCVGGSAGALRL